VPRLEDNPEYKRAAQLAKVGPETWKSWVGALAAVASGFKELTKNAPMGSLLRATGLSDTPPSKPSAADMLLSGVDAVTPTAGIFLGQKAKIADLAKLEEARRLLAHKVPAEQVRKQTGWFQGPADKKWRFEISDEAAEFKPNKLGELREFVAARKDLGRVLNRIKTNYPELRILNPTDVHKHLNKLKNDDLLAYLDADINLRKVKNKLGPTTRAGDLFEHPQLFEAYPELRYIDIEPRSGFGGAISSRGDEIELGMERSSGPTSTMLHELQHGIQGIEDFPRGSSPEAMGVFLDNLIRQSQEYTNAKNILHLMNTKNIPLWDAYRELEDSGNFVGNLVRLQKAQELLFSQQASGMKPDKMANQLEVNHKKVQDILTGLPIDDYQAYRNVAGEYEARKTEARRFMTPEERKAEPPWRDKPPYLHVIR
jgi:hypothetical protein